MSLYLDTEFNGFGGRLISMALYCPGMDTHFYEVLPWAGLLTETWVFNNVIPHLGKQPIIPTEFRNKLIDFLSGYGTHIIYADWPEDFVHLLQQLCGPNGVKHTSKIITMELITVPDVVINPNPHNALSDAKTLYQNHKVMWDVENKAS